MKLAVNFLANGMSVEEVLSEYPQLKEEDIRVAIVYGSEMAREDMSRYRLRLKVENQSGCELWKPDSGINGVEL